jgi:hypothetical protein
MNDSKPRRRRLVAASALFPIVVAMVGACSSGSRSAVPATTTRSVPVLPTPTPTAPATVPGASAVEAGYRAFWGAYLAAADPMNPASPLLPEHATGDELRQVRAAFAGHFAKGEVIRGRLELSPLVESVADVAATVRDCYADLTHVFDAVTGRQKDPSGDRRFQVTATLVLESGAWKVNSISKESEGCTSS